MTDDSLPPTHTTSGSSSETPEVPDSSGETTGRRARRAARRGEKRPTVFKRHPVVTVVTSTLMVLALATVGLVTVAYNNIDGNIHYLPVAIDGKRPKDVVIKDVPHQPLNILVMGSDDRNCKGCHIDKESGGGSDTTILLHLSADRKTAYGVSVPRDLIYDRPECKDTKGNTFPAESDAQWNAAYSVAGPGCTITQFEQMTHIRVDHYVVVNFGGFKDMVDAVGGVKVCIPQQINDQEHGIVLPKGTHTIDGNEALSYVRERHGIGDGSDLGRIKRQQSFIASMVKSVLSAKTLSNPFRIYKFLKAATGAIEVDKSLGNLHDLADLGYGFRNIGLDKIKFFTMPIATDPEDPNRVIPASTAPQLWKLLKHDKTVPGSLTVGAVKAGDPFGKKLKRKHKDTTGTQELASAGLCA